jgi:hypothetical protein
MSDAVSNKADAITRLKLRDGIRTMRETRTYKQDQG